MTQRLIKAWEYWDRFSKDSYAANTLEDEVQKQAVIMGISGSELRRRVITLRVTGQSAASAIRQSTT